MAFSAVKQSYPGGYKPPVGTGPRTPAAATAGQLGLRPAPGMAGSGGGGGGATNRNATIGAKAFRDAMGLPSFEDLFKQLGTGTREFGNAGAATEGAGYLKGDLEAGKARMQEQLANVAAARAGVRNPTQQQGFKDVLNVATERLGNQAENDRRLAAQATARRGYVGGYSPEVNEQQRREAVAMAGADAAAQEREAQLGLFGRENDLYGTMQSGRGAELGAYSDLTKTAAELPTKWLDSISGLLGGLGGGFGDIFGTASRNVQYDNDQLSRTSGLRNRNDYYNQQPSINSVSRLR